ncbi:maestro heat-like repeat-containing protein family member 6 [Colius striatus]|uniref:maestro heat-like repeat-containing protein family member 6 n=1 Tax=Colius striatus TaxID=57412 RepID=UPI002B1DA85B|nr:maestro heat-like repeat-containing protein family member 6 [Colius striatus]
MSHWDQSEEEQHSNAAARHWVDKSLSELVLDHPQDVVVTILHNDPWCHRPTMILWRQLVSTSRPGAGNVLWDLLSVLEDWPLHTTSTSDGENVVIFPLAATRALLEIFWIPQCKVTLKKLFPRFLLALLSQTFFITEERYEEVDAFWRGCEQEGQFPSTPNRFVLAVLKEMLCYLGYKKLFLKVEKKAIWEKLLNNETSCTAMGLLARELHSASKKLCSQLCQCLVELLRRKEPHWDVPSLALLAKFLTFPDMRVWDEDIMELMPSYLQSKCSLVRRLGLRVLISLFKRHVNMLRIRLRHLTELLKDEDGEVVRMALAAIIQILQDMMIPVCSMLALELAERLWPLFTHDNSHVQLLSLQLFQRVMVSVSKKERRLLKGQVQQSLGQLLCHLHDESQEVAEVRICELPVSPWEVPTASRVTLLQAAAFLKKRRLSQLLEMKQIEAVGECLVMPCLRSKQESVREAAIRFLGLAGWYMGDQQNNLEFIYDVLQCMKDDASPSVSKLATETQHILTDIRAEELGRSRRRGRLLWGWRRLYSAIFRS